MSRCYGLILSQFAALNHLNQEINKLIHNKLSYVTKKQFDLPGCYEKAAVVDVGDEQTSNKKIEDAIVNETLKGETLDIGDDDDDEDISEIVPEAAELTKKPERDLEIADSLAEARVRKFVRTLDNSDYEESFNNNSNLGNWTKKKTEKFQTNYIEDAVEALQLGKTT